MPTAEAKLFRGITKLEYWLNEVIFWGLVGQALWATYQSLKIIFFQLPASEKKLLADTITQADVNILINDAILSVFSSIVSILLAAWFARSRAQGAQFWQTALGTIALIINFLLWCYLVSQNSLALIEPFLELFI